MRDSREKVAGMRDQDLPFQTLLYFRGDCYFRGRGRYFRDLIEKGKKNVTFGEPLLSKFYGKPSHPDGRECLQIPRTAKSSVALSRVLSPLPLQSG